jgi:hypothetical protein
LNRNIAAPAKKGSRTMQTTIQPASSPLPTKNGEGFRQHPSEEKIYKVVTVGAILLVLGSLWIF